MTDEELLARIDEVYGADDTARPDDVTELFESFLERLEAGAIRAAEPRDGEWRVNPRVKKGVLLGFQLGENREFSDGDLFQYSDRETYPPQRLPVGARGIRIVPGGSAVRRGAHVADRVTVMPPAYINVGAHVEEDTMVDSHALVGSCAQIGRRVHLSAGAQVGGVLEPVGRHPVIVEDDALIGGNTGLYEGVRVGEGAVVAAGCVVTASSPIYDLAREEIYRAEGDSPPTIPPRAVVIPGSRPASGAFAREHDLQIDALVVVKYRDEETDAQTALEDALR